MYFSTLCNLGRVVGGDCICKVFLRPSDAGVDSLSQRPEQHEDICAAAGRITHKEAGVLLGVEDTCLGMSLLCDGAASGLRLMWRVCCGRMDHTGCASSIGKTGECGGRGCGGHPQQSGRGERTTYKASIVTTLY